MNRNSERLYRIWKHMRNRCRNPNNKSYYKYGGRGISVCKEWDANYECFEKWAVNNGYSDNLSIDRINANGNYEPGNCRWATNHTQDNNKRNSIRVLYKGEYLPIIDVANITGKKYSEVYYMAISNKIRSKRINIV